jgi:hypothetical protein
MVSMFVKQDVYAGILKLRKHANNFSSVLSTTNKKGLLHIYHGTTLTRALNLLGIGFATSSEYTGQTSEMGTGLYFSDNLDYAASFAQRLPGAVIILDWNDNGGQYISSKTRSLQGLEWQDFVKNYICKNLKSENGIPLRPAFAEDEESLVFSGKVTSNHSDVMKCRPAVAGSEDQYVLRTFMLDFPRDQLIQRFRGLIIFK